MLKLEQCDGATRADAIKQLFVRNDRPGFPDFFERVYRSLAAEGGASWVATEDDGSVVMHVAVFPRTFHHAGRTWRAALLGDLIADERYRDFWSPLKLVRRAINDVRRDGRFDFLYTDPSPNSIAIAKAAGFAPLGALRRYVAPVNPLYLAFCGLRARAGSARTVCDDSLDASGPNALESFAPASDLRAARTAEFYRAHSGGELAPTPRYVIVHDPKSADTTPRALGMLAGTDSSDTAALVDMQWDDRRFGVSRALHAVAGAARSHGYRKLSCATLDGSRFASSLVRYGFIGREVIQPIFVLGMRRGEQLPAAPDWTLTSLDGSAW